MKRSQALAEARRQLVEAEVRRDAFQAQLDRLDAAILVLNKRIEMAEAAESALIEVS